MLSRLVHITTPDIPPPHPHPFLDPPVCDATEIMVEINQNYSGRMGYNISIDAHCIHVYGVSTEQKSEEIHLVIPKLT